MIHPEKNNLNMRYAFHMLNVAILSAGSVFTAVAQNTFPATGNVGIGTSNPLENLHINAANPVLQLTSESPTLKSGAIRGNDRMWLFGYVGEPGEELLSVGSAHKQADNRALALNAGGFQRMTIAPNGYIGMGTLTPEFPLDILSPVGSTGLRIRAEGIATDVILNVASGNYGYLSLGDNTVLRGNGNVSYIEGSLGIGTTDPQAKLAVNGNILATEVKIKTDISVPDYVFDENYSLTSLSELEKYIKRHKHLPGIPSANQVAENGLDLAAMNLALLKQVEELVLHIINQDKLINRLSKENVETRRLVDELSESVTHSSGKKEPLEKRAPVPACNYEEL